MKAVAGKAAAAAEALCAFIGKLTAWLLPAMAAVTFLVVVLASVFDWGRIWLQETVTYMHAVLFTSAAAYTLCVDEHVRIDVLYARFGPRGNAWVNLLGSLLMLLPVCAVLAVNSWAFVSSSWEVREGSMETGGIPATYLLKSFIFVFIALMAIQGLAVAVRSLQVLLDSKHKSETGS